MLTNITALVVFAAVGHEIFLWTPIHAVSILSSLSSSAFSPFELALNCTSSIEMKLPYAVKYWKQWCLRSHGS